MERQKLMGDTKNNNKYLINNRLKYDETRHGRSEQYYSLIESNGTTVGRISDDSAKVDKKDKTNLMTIINDLFSIKSNNRRDNSLSLSTTVIFALSVFLTTCVYVDATPVNSGRQSVLFNLSPSARNIRHLPCVSRRTREEGICMFAIDCLKANGTHLGTCIDRFYFGSCCQMPEDIPPITDNHIDENSVFGQSYVKPTKNENNKLDTTKISLPPSTSTTVESTSHKATLSSQYASKPSKVSLQTPTRSPTTTQNAQRISTTSTKSPSHRPTFVNNRPTFSSQKYGSSTQKYNTTKQDVKETTTKRIEVTQHTRKPHPSISTRRPITTGVIVNNTIYTGKLPTVNATKEKDPVKEANQSPETTIRNIQSTTTSTFKPFYLPSRYTTTQKPKNVTHSFETITTTPIKLSTIQYVEEIKKNISIVPETTTQVIKLSTFHSVQGEETKKPTSFTKKPLITGKPTPSPSLGPHLPFGTRLPSGSSSSIKPSSFKPSTVQTTQTKPITTSADTIQPLPLTPTRPTQKPFQKPTTAQKPISNDTYNTTERPLVQRPQNSTLSNRRPTIKPTPPFKKPESTPKPENITSIEPTKKPTTVIYRPSVETRPSLKPTYVSQKPSGETQKPQTTITFRPSTTYNRRPTTTESAIQETVTTSVKPIETHRPTSSSSWFPTKRPVLPVSTLNITKLELTTLTPNITKPSDPTTVFQTTITSTTSKPISSLRPSTVTKKPLVKPSSTLIPVKPSTVTKKPVISSKPTINHIDGIASQKPTTFGQKPLTTTTEKIGLVTWTNYQEPAVTSSPQLNTTHKDEEAPIPSTSEEWVILQTISPPNASATHSTSTVQPSKKPTYTKPTPSRRPVHTTTTPLQATESTTTKIDSTTKLSITSTSVSDNKEETSTTQQTAQSTTILAETITHSIAKPIVPTKKPVTQPTKKPVFDFTTRSPIESSTKTSTTASEFGTKPIFTVLVTTKPLQRPAVSNATEQPDLEFSTFMSVSGEPSTRPTPTVSDKNVTSSLTATETVSSTTQVYDNGTSTQAGTSVFATTTSSSNVTMSLSNTTASPVSSTIAGTLPGDSFNMSDFREVCGRRLWPEARVVGGSKANFGRWPWQVSLRQWRTSTYLHKCGAALLSDNWAITAAHCVDNVAPSDLLLRLGEHDLASEDEPYGYQERRVQIVASHPQFDPRTFEYDLALLRFYEPVNFQPNILPVCVPTKDENFVGKTGYVTGWGRLYEDGPLPSVLQEVRVPVLENEDCEQMYRAAGYIEHIPHIFICAGWRKGGFDSCEGDSGGPLVLQRDDNRFQLAGIISWGIGCAEPNQPGVYTRISEFRDWINQILQF